MISEFFSKLMEWIKKGCEYFGLDGVAHIVVSFALVTILDLIMPLWISALIVFIIGLVKEFYYDKYLGRGEFSKKDIFADIIGILLACI